MKRLIIGASALCLALCLPAGTFATGAHAATKTSTVTKAVGRAGTCTRTITVTSTNNGTGGSTATRTVTIQCTTSHGCMTVTQTATSGPRTTAAVRPTRNIVTSATPCSHATTTARHP